MHEVRTNDAFEQVVEAFDHPLEKVLRAAGDCVIRRVAICAKR